MNQQEPEKKVKQYLTLLAAFLLPLIITMVICIDHEVYPFGDQCILHIDMYHQYCPFFTEFMDKLKSGGSLMYSWNIGLGSDFVSLYAYYLASPLNWLILLCPKGFVIEFMTILVVLKIALCGWTFAYYLKKHFHTNHYAIAVFGTAYALTAFMAAYAWDIMWTDCLVLAPLIILGLEQLVKEKKVALYYVTLAVSVLANYYISIMICIFLTIYFLILWLESGKEKIKTFFRFAWFSLLAGGTGAILLIPEAIILGESGSQSISFPKQVEWYFNIVTELARHCISVDPYTGRDHWPNIYSGVFVLLLFVLYLLNREISWKKKLPRLFFLAFFVVSFSNNMLDFIWHGLHFPDSLPGRQSFLYSFLLLVICFDAFLHIKGNRFYDVIFAFIANIVFLIAAYRIAGTEMVTTENYLVTGIFIGCYAVLLILWMIGKAQIKEYMLLIGMITAIAELTMNFDMTGLGTTNRFSYVKDLADYRTVLEQVEQTEAEESETGAYFYRTEELERKTKNDAALSGYQSATQFSSLMNINVSHIFQNLGMEGGKNFYCINGATPLLSSMLSLKYVIADNGAEENPIRTLVASAGNTYLYENKYALPLGYMIDENVISSWNYSGSDPIANQNELAYLLGAEDAMLTAIPSTSEQGVSTILVEEDGYLFATYEKITTDSLTEEISDGRTKTYQKASHGYTLDLGYCNAGDVVKITNSNQETVKITAYQLNLSAVDAAYQTLSSQTMNLTAVTDTDIKGTIDVTNAGRLVLSVAKEDGWNLYVDGEKMEPEMFAEAFISVHLEEGTHEIELKYATPGLAEGAVISGSCIGLFLVSFLLMRRKERNLAVRISSEKSQQLL